MIRVLSNLALIFAASAILAAASLHANDAAKFGSDAKRSVDRYDVGYGEQFCWYVNFHADYFVKGYKVYGDPEWIAEGAKFFDWAISKMQKDPDGYLGWIGPAIGSEKQKDTLEFFTDTVVGDSIVLVSILGWAETVLNDPSVKSRFGSKAQEYVKLAESVLWEKFNSRGQFYTCSAGWVSYPTYGKMVRRSDWSWVDKPERVISNNLNKHYDLAHGLLRLYRMTGRDEFKERAIRVFGRAKAMFRYYDDEDRYVWNFWMPHAPYDMEGQSPRSWVSVHPSRAGYQSGEAKMFTEAYDTGIVFTLEDMQRIARTNAWMGERNWVNAEGGKAGTVWGAVARFDDRVQNFYEKRLAGGRDSRSEINRLYYEKVLKNAGQGRLFREPGPNDLVDVPLKDGEFLSMTQVIPNRIELVNDSMVQLATKTRRGGTLSIEFTDREGRASYGTIYENTHIDGGQFDSPLWDGTVPGRGKPRPGVYGIRWTFEGETRLEPIWIVEGERRAQTGPQILAQGQTIREDFEGEPSDRWELNNAEPSSDQAHSGRRSLKVSGSAKLLFGAERRTDLPVRVSMWVYDSGARGGKSGNGPFWGMQNTLGDQFVIRMTWRPYLRGNSDYAWFNTAQNRFFTPNPTKVGRSTGWSQWIFDYTGATPKITKDGEHISDVPDQWSLDGAVAITLSNGNPGGPLYVDDIVVDYP